MHYALRAFYLVFGGLLTTSASIALGTLYDLSLVSSKIFWARIEMFPTFQIIAISTMLAMLYPPAFYGMRALDNIGSKQQTWGENAELSVFLEMSLLILPLMMIFPSNEAALGRVFMSRDAYVSPFILLWWCHGAINAYHVRLMKRREQE